MAHQKTLMQSRPLLWDDFVGNAPTVSALRKHAKENSWPSAILLTGKSGMGKTSLTNLISRTVRCTDLQPDGNPCNKCTNCKDVLDENFFFGFRNINGADAKLEDLRSLEESLDLLPMDGKPTIVFLDEFQRIAAKTTLIEFLLTQIEKPRKHVLWIMGAMEERGLTTALKRRVKHYRLNPLAVSELIELISSKIPTDIELDDVKVKTIMALAEASFGSPGVAMAYLERCLSDNLWDVDLLADTLDIETNDAVSGMLYNLLKGNLNAAAEYKGKDSLSQASRYITLLTRAYKVGLGLGDDWEKKSVGDLATIPLHKIRNAILRLSEITGKAYILPEELFLALCDLATGGKHIATVTDNTPMPTEGVPTRKVRTVL